MMLIRRPPVRRLRQTWTTAPETQAATCHLTALTTTQRTQILTSSLYTLYQLRSKLHENQSYCIMPAYVLMLPLRKKTWLFMSCLEFLLCTNFIPMKSLYRCSSSAPLLYSFLEIKDFMNRFYNYIFLWLELHIRLTMKKKIFFLFASNIIVKSMAVRIRYCRGKILLPCLQVSILSNTCKSKFLFWIHLMVVK